MKNLKLLKKSTSAVGAKISSICLSNNMDDGLFCAAEQTIFFSSGTSSKEIVTDVIDDICVLQNGLSLYCANDTRVFSYDSYDGRILDNIEFPLRILALSLCPDESMLLVLTEDLTFTVLSSELEILSEFNLEQDGFGSAAPLTVGWGKKETQFHGKAGKECRTIKETVDDSSLFDTAKVFIAWKDDGEYFAVSWTCTTPIQENVNVGARLIRVFSKDGELFSTSEAINVLENGLFWRSKGSLLATSCRSPKGLEIVFLEQNGLRHGGFMLYDKDNCQNKIVTSVQFALSEDICAVSILDKETNQTYVHLYNTNNYHWYLKQHIVIDSSDLVHMLWCNDKLHMCTSDGTHSVYQWYEQVDRSLILEYDCSDIHSLIKRPNLVAVIDGKKLLMTPFENCIIPPPYCAFTIDFDDYVSMVSLPVLHNLTTDTISLFVQLSSGICKWIQLKQHIPHTKIDSISTNIQFGRKEHQYHPISSVTMNLNSMMNKICWIDNDSFYGVFGNCLYLCKLCGSAVEIKKMDHTGIEVANICLSDKLYIQDAIGSVYNLDVEPNFLFKFSSFCQEMLCLKLKSDDSETILGLSRRFNQLFVNENLQSGSYLSMVALKHHVILTNVNQKLRCLTLHNTLKEFCHMLDEKNYSSNCNFDETLRLIEPGTEIITCVPGDSKIILMMPRGNLEAICPRALVLDDMKTSMERNLYSACIEKARRHRVNLNLLYDHNPENFLKNLPSIVNENRKNDRLILLISELSTEDFTATMYKRFYDNSGRVLCTGNEDKNEKVNRICSAIIGLVNEENVSEDYLFALLTAYVKMTPSRADKALQRLCAFKDKKEMKIWEKGLKYLQYLISIDDLYRIALSTYDLKLTLQVAQKTQLDPKEYVDFLNDLNELPCENYRRYKINMFLKQYVTAMECLCPIADSHWEEILELIKAHNLYIKALQLFAIGTRFFTEISGLFADQLISKSNDLKSAGMVYVRTGDREMCEKAATCFLRTLDWKQWCVASKRSEMATAEVEKNLKHFADRLQDIGRHKESMDIYEIYLNDSAAAFKVSLGAMLFTDSLRIASKPMMADVGEMMATIEMEVLKAYVLLTAQLDEMLKKFNGDLARLTEIRAEFIKKFGEMQLTGDDEVLPGYMSDTMSEVSSVHSMSSVGSNRSNSSQKSSKAKKKPQRKLWSDKTGSQKEEVGVMDRLNTSIRNAQNMTDEMRSFVEILSLLNKVDESSALIGKMNKLLSVQAMSINRIWDSFVFDSTFELNEYEYPISNHIKVSRGPNFTGRRRYMIDEEFLRQPPQMKTTKVSYGVCNFN